jgi:hypothetical protein
MNPKSSSGTKLALAAVFAGTILTACAASPRRVYVRTAPPVAIVEVRGTAPGAEHVWIPGFHAWRGSDYVWVPGHWDRGPRPGAVWVNGQWRQHRDGWYWVEGRWK